MQIAVESDCEENLGKCVMKLITVLLMHSNDSCGNWMTANVIG